jgi:SagB-type dehydrogenase family enzyme
VSGGTKERSRARSRGIARGKTSELVKYRRAPFLISYWRGEHLIFENFLTRRQIVASPFTSTILHFFHRDRPLRDLYSFLSEFTPASLWKAVRSLAQHSLLQRHGATAPLGEKHLAAWSEWNPVAGFFHLSTRDFPFEPDAKKEFRALVRLAKTKPIPKPIKRYPKAQQVTLPAPAVHAEFPRVLLERRTWRQFSKRPVSLPQLGHLLGLTWGVRRWVDIPKVGRVAAKTSPSGGALHPIEAYILVRNVEGLGPGIYHYSAADHRLELLRRGANSRQITDYLANQYWYGGAAFVVFMTAVFARTQWKYDYARAYRAVLIEAGHLCQTFCLTATWLGAAPFCTMAFADSRIEKALGIDGIAESVLYVAGAGVRPENEKQAHLLSGTQNSKLNL